MDNKPLNDIIWAFDDRRNIALPGNYQEALQFSKERWIHLAQKAIEERGVFNCALSGGSTPAKIFALLKECKSDLDWSKVRLYFSDERCVPPDHKESNFHSAWEAGFKDLISKDQIFPMYHEGDPEIAAKKYEMLIAGVSFDLIMLGMGDDGHTASLFPFTHALHSDEDRTVVANFLPEKEIWRITFTFHQINSGKHINFYVFGISKAEKIKEVLTGQYEPDNLPSQKIGTRSNKALWILDQDSASLLSY